MRPLEGFVGGMVKLSSHQFPFLMKVQQEDREWGEENCSPVSHACFLHFLVTKIVFAVSITAVQKQQVPSQLLLFQPKSRSPPQIPGDHPHCMCIVSSS